MPVHTLLSGLGFIGGAKKKVPLHPPLLKSFVRQQFSRFISLAVGLPHASLQNFSVEYSVGAPLSVAHWMQPRIQFIQGLSPAHWHTHCFCQAWPPKVSKPPVG